MGPQGPKDPHQPWPALPVSSSVGRRACSPVSARPAPGSRTSWHSTRSSPGPGRRSTWPSSRPSGGCGEASVSRATHGSWPGAFPTIRPATRPPRAGCSVRFWRPGFRVESIVTPPQALALLAASRPRSGNGAVAWLALNIQAAAIAIVHDGELLFARTFEWSYSALNTSGKAQLLQRYSLVAQLAPEVRRGIAAVLANRGLTVEQAVTCGDLPELRSLTMPLIEELDLEVETLDSTDGLRAVREGEGRALRRVRTRDPSGLRGGAGSVETAGIRDPVGRPHRRCRSRHLGARVGELRALARGIDGRDRAEYAAAVRCPAGCRPAGPSRERPCQGHRQPAGQGAGRRDRPPGGPGTGGDEASCRPGPVSGRGASRSAGCAASGRRGS